MVIVCMYLVEILLELTLGPISTLSHEYFCGKCPLFLERITYIIIIILSSAQFVNLCNFEIAPRKLELRNN